MLNELKICESSNRQKLKDRKCITKIVTFRDLQKLVQLQFGPEHSRLLHRLKDKPFWIWDQDSHRQEDIRTKGDCCFNHIISLPIKDKVEMPLFDYEKLILDTLLMPELDLDVMLMFRT